MAEALLHPDRTWQQHDVVTYPTLEQAAALYRGLFDERCATTATELPDGRWVVPSNRWDLAEPVDRDPRVSVVIPYFRQQRQLEFVLTALTLQSYSASLLQVIVADDGSPKHRTSMPFGPLSTSPSFDRRISAFAQRLRAISAHRSPTGRSCVFWTRTPSPNPGTSRNRYG